MRAVRAAALLSTGALALSGCQFRGAASLPLPGGVGGGYEVKIEFSDVLDLVPQSAVKVNDVTVGSVRKVELSPGGYTAVVTASLKKGVVLPENATAALRQTSLLGEKFVSLDAPPNPTGRLRDGMYIPLARTERNADIEEVLGALSLVLNGGSLEQLQVINSELTKALAGREPQVRAFLEQLTGFVGGLDAQKDHIVAALDGLDRLSGKLAANRQTLDVALRDLPRGASVLADERAQLTKLLKGLNNLGTVATRVIQTTQQATIADLRALQPILGQLAASGQDLPDALELLTTFPFPRTVADPVGRGGMRGDYANLFVTVDSSVQDLLNNLLGGGIPGLPVPLSKPAPGTTPKATATPKPAAPGVKVPAVPGVELPPVEVPSVDGLGEQGLDLVLLLLGGLR
ncbi:MAG TPA: MCE family protein [Mycobacteriales bacterium]|nr:MCE family protein [Mycobacteriales bacterium]